jgi:hypothetical protein
MNLTKYAAEVITLATHFNQQLFADLLKQALGNRSINQYALHCGVSAAYVSRLLRQVTKNPPNPPIIAKMANKAHDDVTYIKLMEAAGHLPQKEARSPCEHLLHETSPQYVPDLADILNQRVVNYKGLAVDTDTRNIIAAILQKFCHNKEQNSRK